MKASATVDGQLLAVALMPTGMGGHLLSVSARVRKKIGKDLGDAVTVSISERLS